MGLTGGRGKGSVEHRGSTRLGSVAGILAFVIIAVCWSVALLGFVAFYRRIRKGRWRSHRTATGHTQFESDLGRFSIGRSGEFRIESVSGAPRTIALGHITAVRFAYEAKTSLSSLAEFDIQRWEKFGAWSDQLDWYEIALVTQDGDVPIFVAGQLDRSLPLLTWLFAFANSLLERWRMVDDIHERSRSVLEDVVAAFREVGHPLPLA
jgi:hypothetical protein